LTQEIHGPENNNPKWYRVKAIVDDYAPGAVLELSWISNGVARSISVATGDVEIVEPRLRVERTPSLRSLETGDMLRCSVRIDHSPESACDAWNVVLRESIPAGHQDPGGEREDVS